MSRPVLQVVAASTRPGRRGLADARWVQRLAEEHAGFDVELVDLAEVGLADAFVLVTPEYDHSSPASLENALDHLSAEQADEAAGLVTCGGVSAGLRASSAVEPVLGALRVHVVLEAVSVPFFAQFLDEEDEFVPDAELVAGGRAVLDELARVTTALGTLRAA